MDRLTAAVLVSVLTVLLVVSLLSGARIVAG